MLKSIALFLLAALLEIGGAWLVWQSVREHRGWIWAGAGVIALGAYGFVAARSRATSVRSVHAKRGVSGCRHLRALGET